LLGSHFFAGAAAGLAVVVGRLAAPAAFRLSAPVGFFLPPPTDDPKAPGLADERVGLPLLRDAVLGFEDEAAGTLLAMLGFAEVKGLLAVDALTGALLV